MATELRQLRTGSRLPMLEEQPGWMGFRSSIDGFNVNQHPSTGPGGAQDHQDPVAYSNGRWPSGTGARMRVPANVMGAGGSIYQAPGRDQSGGRFAGGNGPSGHSGNWQRVVAPRDPRLLVALAGDDDISFICSCRTTNRLGGALHIAKGACVCVGATLCVSSWLLRATRCVSCWRLPAVLNVDTNGETWHAFAQVNVTHSTQRTHFYLQACLALMSDAAWAGAGAYPYDSPASLDSDPKHGYGGYGGGANAGALSVGEADNPRGSYYCADCTW